MPPVTSFHVILVTSVIVTTELTLAAGNNYRVPCLLGTFPCGNSSKCVEQRFQCNGVKNCPNGEDEKDCVESIASVDALVKYFSKNSTQTMKPPVNHSCELSNYPPKCSCVNATMLFCNNTGLVEFPGEIIGNISRLILTNNYISSLPRRILKKYTYLTLVNLEFNTIHEIEPYAFEGSQRLKRLLLRRNRLKTIIPESFVGLNNTIWMRLKDNLLEDLNLTLFTYTPNLDWLDLSNNSLTLANASFPRLKKLLWLNLRENKIERITEEMFFNLTALAELQLSKNKIKYVHPKAFSQQKELIELNLADNSIEYLYEETFFNQKNLTILNLGGNRFLFIQPGLFKKLYNLNSLDLKNINMDNISIQMFIHMTKLEFITFKKFHYCSYVPHVRVCKPNTDGVSSMEHLLVNPFLRSTVWVVAILTCIGNAMVILGRLAVPEDNKVLSIFIRNLSAADFLMGVYLLVIGAHDIEFREHYNQYANTWMSSWKCTFSGILAMTSSETSVLIMCFMSVERFICIVNPFGGNRLTIRKAMFSMTTIWMTGLLLSLLPIIHWSHSNEFYGSNGMCFPLHIDDPFIAGWQYSTFLFLGINFLSVIIIILVYLAMFVSIQKTRKATTLLIRDKEFAFRFFFIVFTDCLCWIPIIILKLVAIVNISVTADLYAWVVVFILPINSAVNPFLYTFTTTTFRTRAKKFALAFFIIVSNSLSRKESKAETTLSSDNNYCFKEESEKIIL